MKVKVKQDNERFGRGGRPMMSFAFLSRSTETAFIQLIRFALLRLHSFSCVFGSLLTFKLSVWIIMVMSRSLSVVASERIRGSSDPRL
jgi:hypothetical protein